MVERLSMLKTILWTIVGVGATVTLFRFAHGLGAATALHDTAPWGLWIGFDVMAGVALAAGGFVLAATVYICGLEKYRPFVRPAILTAFLGYTAVAIGLLYDLGLPWRIWHPMIFPQHHSVLFEVAMCVMLYLTVLALEFAPVVLEHPLFSHPLFKTVLSLLKKFTIVLIIAGIVLSTLHQSSLGSLFLITPYRLHPLWYSPIIYVLFFISAIGLGLMTVCSPDAARVWPELPLAALFDAALFSCKVGLGKPDPDFYALAFERLGIAPGGCLYVGDGAGNELTGAKRAGAHPVLICAPSEEATVMTRDEARNWTGPTIHQLSDVLTIVQEEGKA